MNIFGRVAVALARADTDAGLLRYAGMVAGAGRPAAVHFAHVLRTGEGAGPPAAEVRDQALRELRESVSRHFGHPPAGTEVSFHVLTGTRVDCLLAFAADLQLDLILTGHRKVSTGRRSLCRRLAMKAPCPVWVVPEGSPARIGKVLAAVDFSTPSAHALSVAASVASGSGLSEATALHVYSSSGAEPGQEYDAPVRGNEKRVFEQFVTPLALHGIQIRPRFQESAGVPLAIARTVETDQVDLVVMGVRGCSQSEMVLIGTESEQALQESKVPILLVKPPGEGIGLLQVLLDTKFKRRETLRSR